MAAEDQYLKAGDLKAFAAAHPDGQILIRGNDWDLEGFKPVTDIFLGPYHRHRGMNPQVLTALKDREPMRAQDAAARLIGGEDDLLLIDIAGYGTMNDNVDNTNFTCWEVVDGNLRLGLEEEYDDEDGERGTS